MLSRPETTLKAMNPLLRRVSLALVPGLVLSLASLQCSGQAPATGRPASPPATIQDYLTASVADANHFEGTVADWTAAHPGDKLEVDTLNSAASDPRTANIQDRWCLRSTAPPLALPGGITVTRVALFDGPSMEGESNDTLPPLPTVSGDALRREGCRLYAILYEFMADAGSRTGSKQLAATLAAELPYPREKNLISAALMRGNEGSWTWFASYFHRDSPMWDAELGYSTSSPSSAPRNASALLVFTSNSSHHGPPSKDTVDPQAGAPSLAIHAAALARQPQPITLDMLALFAPARGAPGEQPPFSCNRQLIPVLRSWIDGAKDAPAQQLAAALLLADLAAASRLDQCSEYPEGIPYGAPQAGDPDAPAYNALHASLDALGIGTTSYRLGESYSGTLLPRMEKLAPSGPAGELYRIAVIDDPCTWEQAAAGPGASAEQLLAWPHRVISVGESILHDDAADEWTPSVHLTLAEAYALAWFRATDRDQDDASAAQASANPAALLEKAQQHYRAWFAASTNDRDRKLVWREIWDLQAGLPPRLMLPSCGIDGYM